MVRIVAADSCVPEVKDIRAGEVVWHSAPVLWAPVFVGRRLGIRLWILLRDQIDYAEFCRRTR